MMTRLSFHEQSGNTAFRDRTLGSLPGPTLQDTELHYSLGFCVWSADGGSTSKWENHS